MIKADFDPYQWAKNDYCEEPEQNPGELIISCGKQSEAIIKASKGDKDLQQIALRVLNLAASVMQEEWADKDTEIPPEVAESLRRSLVQMYLLGEQSARLRDATLDDGEIMDALIQAASSKGAKRAADARHSKPGGSRELKARIREVWAGGKYSTKDICTEEEWSALGFNSFSTARKALRNA